jgi:hypothetical protein
LQPRFSRPPEHLPRRYQSRRQSPLSPKARRELKRRITGTVTIIIGVTIIIAGMAGITITTAVMGGAAGGGMNAPAVGAGADTISAAACGGMAADWGARLAAAGRAPAWLTGRVQRR